MKQQEPVGSIANCEDEKMRNRRDIRTLSHNVYPKVSNKLTHIQKYKINIVSFSSKMYNVNLCTINKCM